MTSKQKRVARARKAYLATVEQHGTKMLSKTRRAMEVEWPRFSFGSDRVKEEA